MISVAKIDEKRFFSLLSYFEHLLAKASYREKEAHEFHSLKHEESWEFIPLQPNQFIAILNDFGNTKGKNFLDIGSGPGSKLIITNCFADFNKVHGIEFNPGLCKGQYFGTDTCIFNEDLFKFNNYKYYDCLYTYMPLKNPDNMAKALELIMDNMKVGATLYFVRAGGSKKLDNLIDTKFKQTRFAHKFVKK